MAISRTSYSAYYVVKLCTNLAEVEKCLKRFAKLKLVQVERVGFAYNCWFQPRTGKKRRRRHGRKLGAK